MARRRPSSVLPVLSRAHGGPVKPKPRSGLPKGVSKTLSGKYQARINVHSHAKTMTHYDFLHLFYGDSFADTTLFYALQQL
jgi:hypothetical protein